MDESKKGSEVVLILAPTEQDSQVARDVLTKAGFEARAVQDLEELTSQLEKCGALVIAEEALDGEHKEAFQVALEHQEAWSDIPVVLLSGGGPREAANFFPSSGNIALLERPFSRVTLVQALDVALRARRRQYEIRDFLLEQKLQTQKRDEFFATLSHELRTPLNLILGWLEILRRDPLNKEEMQATLEILERAARTQKGLIDDLLDISRIVNGKLVIDKGPVNLPVLVESTVDAFVPRATDKGISLNAQIPEEDVYIEADESRFGQVLSNLLINSIKFTPRGGRINVALSSSKDTVQITMEDTGQGIDAAFLPHIFDRLKQEDMSTTRSHGGLGLGLAIAHYIVTEHRGQIRAESEGRGRGARMIVTVPRIPQPQQQASSVSEATESASLKGMRVLVVDDSPDILELIGMWLRGAGADVRFANTAPSALEELKEFHPNMLVSDIGMPEMDGYQLISKIRALPKNEGGDIPAVALTAYARDEEKKLALKAGFQVHISKPMTNSELVSALSRLSRGDFHQSRQ